MADKEQLSLNEAQARAVAHREGPMVVFAGAGSGKTRVITTRIGALIEEGVRPGQILAVTFTNKAAREMRERVSRLTGDGGLAQIGTFHAMCARWLREFATELGFTPDFTIYDDKDSTQAIKKVMAELRIDEEQHAPKEYKNAIGRVKTMAWQPSDLERSPMAASLPFLACEVYKRYQSYLAQCNAMDFSDLLLNMLILLKNNREVRERLQQRYRYIMVDEYQDTNPAQFSLINALLSPERNLFVVGDDDQSIYSWRGADPSNILGFRKLFPDAEEVRLEQNYRSTGNIIAAANHLILNNRTRAEKVLWTSNDAGEKIDFQLELDGGMEAWWVAETLRRDLSRFPYHEIAIFYRTNAQSRLLEEVLRKNNIPYRLYGSLRFYDRAEIKDVVAYFRLLVNPDDDVALRRVLNVPGRGLGKKALSDIDAWAVERGSSLMQACREIAAADKPRISKKLAGFVAMMGRLTGYESLGELLALVLSETGYKEYLREKFPAQMQDKLTNIHELGTALTEYGNERPDATLFDWLRDVSLSENDREEVADSVSLMTLHAAKGLEFRRVFIVGVEDGLIPHSSNVNDQEKLEEERRLLYVGMTRAREKLSLVAAQQRRVFNRFAANPLSRFLQEIPEEYFPSLPRSSQRGEDWPAAGAVVRHKSYGRGVVRAMDDEAVVDFYEVGARRVDPDKLTPPSPRRSRLVADFLGQ